MCLLAPQVWGLEEQHEHIQKIQQEIQSLEKHESAKTEPMVLAQLAGLYLSLGEALDGNVEKQIAAYENGAALAKQALTLDDHLANAHFYYAANLGNAMQLKGAVASAMGLQELKAHTRRALALQEDHAPALHMLGRILEELPWLLGGDEDAGLAHLKKAVVVDRYYARAHLDLAKLYLKRKNVPAAVTELQAVIQQPRDKQNWSWKHRYRPEAESMLAKLGNSEVSGLPED